MASVPDSTALEAPQNVRDLLARLHKLSLDQEEALHAPDGDYTKLKQWLKENQDNVESKRDEIMIDKFIALEGEFPHMNFQAGTLMAFAADKATFVYNLIRATNALNVVEAGTSFGVSTIYLALAVGQNAKAAGKRPGEAKVIATEFESTKAAQARKYWNEAGETVEPWIELFEGDLRQSLSKADIPVVDFVLFDIWTPMVVPTLEILEPKFRNGTTLVCDNTQASHDGYAEFFKKIKAPGSHYTTLTLPYSGGLEMVTYHGP